MACKAVGCKKGRVTFNDPGVVLVAQSCAGNCPGKDCLGLHVINNIANNNDIKHFIRIANLRLYPLVINCDGCIPQNGNVHFFSNSNPNAIKTENNWEQSWYVKEKTNFSDIYLIPDSQGSTEIVSTFSVIWPYDAKDLDVSLCIDVES